LNARPKPEETRNLANRKKQDEVPSRREQMEQDGIDPIMPPLAVPWLFEVLFDLGPTEPGGMGAAAIGWRSLDAWCSRTGVDLPPWQCRLLRRVSGEYLIESDRARKMDCPSPWATRKVEQNREAVTVQVESLFDRLMSKGKG
jgi:hypothetical protein